jgi:aerobic-type carbon monoxide dehydrogenase small subunit (CoxS/CutS family)
MPEYRLILNGAERKIQAPAVLSLLDLIRDYAGLIGAKYGCGEGQCGACTMLLNDRAVNACVTPASAANGAKVVTIEGLPVGGQLHPVQRAFLDTGALQCGFCTPGMILGATALLSANQDPSEEQVRTGLNGHLCRCGTYPRIVEAVRLAARLQREAGRG